MRPNIDISHTLNGRVRDYAEENGMSLPEAYEQVIRAGLDGVAQQDSVADRQPDTTPERQRDSETAVVETAALDLPASVDQEAAEAAVAAAVNELRQRGSASKGELVAAVMPEHPLGYDVESALEQVETPGERYRGAWWRRIVKPGLEAEDSVTKPSGGRSEWRWTE